jgi:O-methyltransferase involved in polyketide biosynthesis
VALYSHPSADEVTELLREAGFSQIEQQTRDEEADRYFRDRADGLVAPDYQRIAMAIK